MPLSWSVLDLDCASEVDRICESLRESTVRLLRKRGAVVAISGGVDSAVCAALAARAFGPERVLGLILPERESSPNSSGQARSLAAHLGIRHVEQDVTQILEMLGCYRFRDEAARRVLPAYGLGWRMKITLAGGLQGGINHYRLIARAPDGVCHELRLGLREYLEIVAATSFKQRVRKTLEYFHADRMNYAVVGTPNRLEYDQGFFVKNGDGSADIKPIAHLYKSQVYALATHLGLPATIAAAPPTSDTYSLPQGQEELYFGLPFRELDLALWALDHGIPVAELAKTLEMTEEEARNVYQDIGSKRRASRYLHESPLLVDPYRTAYSDHKN